MNKSKLPMAAKARKKVNKEIRLSAAKPDTDLGANNIKPEAVFSRPRAKNKQKEQEALDSFVKRMQVKIKKKSAKHSRRTTPGTVEEQSPPQSVHIEGARWIKSLAKQARAKNKVVTRKMTKKGTR